MLGSGFSLAWCFFSPKPDAGCLVPQVRCTPPIGMFTQLRPQDGVPFLSDWHNYWSRVGLLVWGGHGANKKCLHNFVTHVGQRPRLHSCCFRRKPKTAWQTGKTCPPLKLCWSLSFFKPSVWAKKQLSIDHESSITSN